MSTSNPTHHLRRAKVHWRARARVQRCGSTMTTYASIADNLEACRQAYANSTNAQKAFTVPLFDEAAQHAERLDATPATRPAPALWGVPIAVKDIFDMHGHRTFNGRQSTRTVEPAESDAAVVSAIRRAGAAIVGRTHQTEMAFSATGYNPHYPQPHSPFGKGLMPGGSSSGSAVAVAEGVATVALGTDTGGSIRVPAAWCGVVGFKPTSGLISLEGVVPLAPSLDACGFFSRNVADCARMLSVCAPHLDTAEGTMKPTPRDVWDSESKSWAIPSPQNLRIACLEGTLTNDMDAPTEASYRAALDAMRGAGMSVEPLELPFFDEIMEAMRVIFYVEGAHSNLAIARDAEELAQVDETVRLRIVDGSAIPATEYVTALRTRARLQTAMSELTANVDAIVLPTVPVAPPDVAKCESDPNAMATAARMSSRNTRLSNVLNVPAISLPCHKVGAEFPAGLTVMGRTRGDGALLARATAIERVLLAL
ncbi:amidase [Pycnococcus provasolii]